MNKTMPISESLPASLSRSVPRQVALTAAGRVTLAATALLWLGGLLGGAWLYVAAERDVTLRQEVANHTVAAWGEVLSVQKRRDKEGKAEVTYRYTAGGRDYFGRAQLPRRESKTLEPGQRIPVRFLASAPARSWLPGHEPQGVEFWMVPLVTLPLFAVGVLITLTLRRQYLLLACGCPALARVTETRKVQHGHGHGFHVSFEFRLLTGSCRRGAFDAQRNPPAAGSSLVIVYDPDHPQRNARYPMALVRLAPHAA